MAEAKPVIVAGAGPVGLVAAAELARNGVKVLVLESGADLAAESRASTFHPPTLDMLDEFGAAAPLIADGLVAPKLQYRTKADGVVAQFDFGAIADLSRHPYRLQAEQFKLTRIIHRLLRGNPNFAIEFGAEVNTVRQDRESVILGVTRQGRQTEIAGSWLIGADGARSAVRHALGIGFEGFTWPDRFLVVSTPFDFHGVIPDLCSVSYLAGPQQWHFLLQIPDAWRIMFPVPVEIGDETASSAAYIKAQMATIVAGMDDYEICHHTLYRVHQRVAASFRAGRVFLAGDAAHINNPLGGMGMNGGVHDAVNIAGRLAEVWHDKAKPETLDRYDRQRRLVTLEYVQKQTIQNKQNLEARDPTQHAEFKRRMREIAADPARAREYLINLSMIGSLKRAEELG
jgi:3-(3-hydroxy-phenyl)propionate hydroxylase